jgi:D-serine deaminase-like pyridoxal phosphate-dependent protein
METMPLLLLDRRKCLKNIEKMALKAKRHGLGFRPHFKTHQSAGIGDWFRDFGVSGITVSSFRMAEYFARAGWKDLLVAFPFNPSEVEQLNSLAEDHSVSILLDNPEVLPYLEKIGQRTPFYIDIDTGYGRTGVRSEDAAQVERIIRGSRAAGNLHFAGFYCHAGHSYRARGPAERERIHLKAIADLRSLKAQFSGMHPVVLYGDTPSCSTQEDFEGIDTITPGNFVFYDLFQSSIGSCTEDEIAVAMACPVASKYPAERKLLIHGGAVHFSKEMLQVDGRTVFGRGVVLREGLIFDDRMSAGTGKEQAKRTSHGRPGWSAMEEPLFLSEISQEHGIIRDCPAAVFDHVRIGDMLFIFPVHSCLTANLMGRYVTLEGRRIWMQSRPE